jgi:tetratricopeptide (TPR) repeat protein
MMQKRLCRSLTSEEASPPAALGLLGAGRLLTLGVALALGLVVGCAPEEPSRETPEATPEAQQASPPMRITASTRKLLDTGTQALRQQQFRKAMALADSLEERDSTAAHAPFLRARVHSTLGRFAAADSAYRAVLARDSDYPGVWHNRGNNALRQGRNRKAAGYFRKAIAHDYAEERSAALPWRGLGQAYHAQGRADSAKAAFEEALAKDSTYARAHMGLARLLQEEAAFAEALGHARSALRHAEKRQRSEEARYLTGQLLKRTGRLKEALPHLRAAAEARPWHPGATYNLGRILLRLGEEKEGRTYVERSETLRRKQAKVRRARRIVQVSPGSAQAHADLGHALRESGRHGEAMDAYRTALHLEPELKPQIQQAVLQTIRKQRGPQATDALKGKAEPEEYRVLKLTVPSTRW